MYLFYLPMAFAGSPQFTLNPLREVYGTTGSTLRLWHYVRSMAAGRFIAAPNIFFRRRAADGFHPLPAPYSHTLIRGAPRVCSTRCGTMLIVVREQRQRGASFCLRVLYSPCPRLSHSPCSRALHSPQPGASFYRRVLHSPCPHLLHSPRLRALRSAGYFRPL